MAERKNHIVRLPGSPRRRALNALNRPSKLEPVEADAQIGTAPDFVIWQIIDSAFPTGGFAHSTGLEAAWQYGEVRGNETLVDFIEASLKQLGRATLPFTLAAFENPEKLSELDAHCDAFTNNHVANRASRAQGRALLAAMEKIFNVSAGLPGAEIRYAHFAPVFGASLRRLDISRTMTGRIFLFNHLRAVLAAAVRLNIVGPMEAQRMLHRFSPTTEKVLKQCQNLPLDEVAQTAPLLDLWQGAQDRLYSRLFQS